MAGDDRHRQVACSGLLGPQRKGTGDACHRHRHCDYEKTALLHPPPACFTSPFVGDWTHNGGRVQAFPVGRGGFQGQKRRNGSRCEPVPGSGRGPYFAPGGTTFMTNEVGVSVGPNALGVLWLTGAATSGKSAIHAAGSLS